MGTIRNAPDGLMTRMHVLAWSVTVWPLKAWAPQSKLWMNQYGRGKLKPRSDDIHTRFTI